MCEIVETTLKFDPSLGLRYKLLSSLRTKLPLLTYIISAINTICCQSITATRTYSMYVCFCKLSVMQLCIVKHPSTSSAHRQDSLWIPLNYVSSCDGRFSFGFG